MLPRWNGWELQKKNSASPKSLPDRQAGSPKEKTQHHLFINLQASPLGTTEGCERSSRERGLNLFSS